VKKKELFILPKITSDKTSPMMEQYQRIKAENPDALLFFRLGDFYEMFGEDAKEGARLLEITLTARASGEGRAVKIPMCGVPYHAAEVYINRLLKAGRKVAVVEQMEDPRKTKGMVRRELVRIITPGTKLAPDSLEAKQNNYLAALSGAKGKFGLAAVDISTGLFLITEFSGPTARPDLVMELKRLHPAEILLPEELLFNDTQPGGLNDFFITRLEGYKFEVETGRTSLIEHFGTNSLDGFGCGDFSQGLGAAGAALNYLYQTQRGVPAHIHKLTPYSVHSHMLLDEATIRNLEIIRNLADGSRRNTLLEVLDYTLTAMGGRRLYAWTIRPLISLPEIKQRQSAVAELAESIKLRQSLGEVLGRMHDLERLSGRVGAGTAGPRDLKALEATLRRLPEIKQVLAKTSSNLLSQIIVRMPPCIETRDLIARAINDEPPPSLREVGIIRFGFNPEVDELRSLAKEGKGYIASLQVKERKRTGISTLKVEFNNVFGYYIEVSRANSKLVPEDYQRKQTLVNAERYITPELKKYESKVLGAEEKLLELEQKLFVDIRTQVAERLPEILQAADLTADLDAIFSLAETAVRNNYTRPQVTDEDTIEIREGRHPVVERLTREKFIPNDIQLDQKEKQVLIITGPNMAGKSTYLRQNALILIMAQMGGFVPVASACLGIVDRVFTRVGAADNLAGGQSTFMVEMNESANILNNATARSLVILDEVGRGTSTFDGVSIAWAVAEYLHDIIRAKTLFATHYYELTELSLSKERIKNHNIAVREWKENIIFLRKIVEGSADRSYGIQVANLAGLPKDVITRAKEVLTNLEQVNYTETGNSRLAKHASSNNPVPPQISLFEDSQVLEFINELKNLAPESMTPLDALNCLAELKHKYAGNKDG
jgi:DNA mismatch repair protein MutS